MRFYQNLDATATYHSQRKTEEEINKKQPDGSFRCLLFYLLICCCPVVYSEFIRVDECLLETAAAGKRVDETVGATEA